MTYQVQAFHEDNWVKAVASNFDDEDEAGEIAGLVIDALEDEDEDDAEAFERAAARVRIVADYEPGFIDDRPCTVYSFVRPR